MVIETYRIAKEGKLTALIWMENNSVFIKEPKKPSEKVVESADKLSVFLYIKTYCDETSSKEIGKICLEKDDLKDFFERVNTTPKVKYKV